MHIDQNGFFGGTVKYDLGLIILSKPSQLQYMPLADDSEMKTAMDRSTGSAPSFPFCMSSGFGINSEGTAGLPFSTRFDGIYYRDESWQQVGGAQLTPEEVPLILEIEKAKDPVREFAKLLVEKKYIPVTLEAGDSGGPLMCLSEGQWKLFGVVNGHKLNYNTLGAMKLTTNWAPFLKKNIKKRIF